MISHNIPDASERIMTKHKITQLTTHWVFFLVCFIEKYLDHCPTQPQYITTKTTLTLIPRKQFLFMNIHHPFQCLLTIHLCNVTADKISCNFQYVIENKEFLYRILQISTTILFKKFSIHLSISKRNTDLKLIY